VSSSGASLHKRKRSLAHAGFGTWHSHEATCGISLEMSAWASLLVKE